VSPVTPVHQVILIHPQHYIVISWSKGRSDTAPTLNPTTRTSSTPSNFMCNLDPNDLCDLTKVHKQHWVDATNDECLGYTSSEGRHH